jgi:hypothetical protein
MAKRLFFLALGMGLVGALAACDAPGKAVEASTVRPNAAVSAAPQALGPTLLTIRYTGGMCPNGACDTLLTINRDGTYARTSAQTPPKRGTLSPAQVAALTREMARADFARMKAVKFTGTCPSAYDGQELTYTFFTASGPEVLASCTVDIDEASPLFVAVQAIIDAANRE